MRKVSTLPDGSLLFTADDLNQGIYRVMFNNTDINTPSGTNSPNGNVPSNSNPGGPSGPGSNNNFPNSGNSVKQSLWGSVFILVNLICLFYF